MSFSAIPNRNNGDKIDYGWFDTLKTAGVLVENFLGGGFVSETSFSLANNQASAANVTGLLFDKASYKSAYAFVEVRRSTGSSEVVGIGRLLVIYRDATAAWEIIDEIGGDNTGVVFSITSAGQVQYTTDNMSGTGYTGKIVFKALSFAA